MKTPRFQAMLQERKSFDALVILWGGDIDPLATFCSVNSAGLLFYTKVPSQLRGKQFRQNRVHDEVIDKPAF